MNWRRALRFIAAFPLAYIGGSLVFGVLADGTWITRLLDMILKPQIFEWLVFGLVWLTRIGVFVFLMIAWVFEDEDDKASVAG